MATLADSVNIGGLRQKDDLFSEFHIGGFCNHERGREMRTQKSFHLLYLYLDTARTDNIILSAQNAEIKRREERGGRSEFSDIIGDQRTVVDGRCIDDETVFIIQ